jgi:hypothetical protein
MENENLQPAKGVNSPDNMDNLYVKVIAASVLGNKCGPAFIDKSFFSRKDAEVSESFGHIMTRNQATKFITKWNKDFNS